MSCCNFAMAAATQSAVSRLIERVDVFTGYKLKIKLNISVEQFLSGLDIELGENVLKAKSV